jgi:predicted nucleic acid-binding protein
MIACDTSSLAAFLAGDAKAADVTKVRDALRKGELVLPSAALAEALSNPHTARTAISLLSPIPLLEPTPGYWIRVGASRAKLIGKGLKARLADALIAQSCIDASVELIARDRDFRHFATHCGLKLA